MKQEKTPIKQLPKEEKERLIRESREKAQEKINKMKRNFASVIFNLVADKNENEYIQKEVISANLDITPQALANYCDGKRLPQLEQIFLMKEYFNTSYESLLSELPSGEVNKKGDLTTVGLTKKAIRNLESIVADSNEWGFDEQQHIVNPMLFAINKLLEDGNDILYLLGDYLLFPPYANQTNNDDEDIYTELYKYKIMSALEKFTNNFRDSKEGKNISQHRTKKVEEILSKTVDFNNYSNYIDEELTKIQSNKE